MPIEIRIIEKFPKEILDDLVKRNLENSGIFIKEEEFYSTGDSRYSCERKKLRVAAYDGEKMIGLSFGMAQSKNRFMMHISLVEEAYRKQGIYDQMLNVVLENTREFDEIDSCHHLFNNQIIAAKLRRGFHIIGIETSIFIGQLLRLRYYNNEKLLEFMRYRVGLSERPLESRD